MTAPSDIPFFGIYGERPQEVDPRFVHVERMRDRSAIHEGRVRPHRHAHLHQISLWLAGKGTYLLEGERLPLPESALTLTPAGTVHGFDVAPACDSIVISLSDDFLRDCLAGVDEGLAQTLRHPRLVSVDAPSFDTLLGWFEAVEEEYRYAPPLQSEAIAAYVRLILISATRLIRASAAPISAGHRSALLSRFQILLDAHFRDRWSVARYVDALGTTAYLLNTATRTGLGCEASAVIHARVKTEAKRLLLYTMLNVTEIATTLGYGDSAHFSRMFRQATGLAPAEWRRANVPDPAGPTSLPGVILATRV